jgi:predicted dehydrogenase
MSEPTISRRSVLSASAASALLAACSRGGGGLVDENPRGIGVAVVGLGTLTTGQVIPALAQTQNCYLAGLVSSSADKLRELGAATGVPEDAQYTYDDFDRIAQNREIQFVYIAVPNALHADFAVRAARAGKHVLCEKPLAASVKQAESMIAASKAARKYLAVGYRVHFSPHHREVLRLSREQVFGPVSYVRANIGFSLGEDADWRLKRNLAGGGVLLEQGVYAVHAARSLIGMNPVQVFGHETTSDPARFAEVEESVIWTMLFPNGAIAQCGASYTMPMNKLWAGAKAGSFELEPAYGYDNLRGISTAGDIQAERANQFVAQFDDFAARIRDGVPPEKNSGEEGLIDVEIVNAIYESIREGRPIALG